MSEAAAAPKPKKSVALSGVPAGNTALCTVGRTGNDLHYRGYDILECIPANAHPMDVLRTGCSALGAVLPEHQDHKLTEARDIADRMMASFGSMLLYWHHFSHSGRRIEVETDDDSIGGHYLHLLHGKKPSALWERAMHTPDPLRRTRVQRLHVRRARHRRLPPNTCRSRCRSSSASAIRYTPAATRATT